MALAVVLVALGACGDDTASNAPEEATPPPAPLSARIELDAQTVTIGGTIDGRVVVANNTGENIDVTGCGSIFQVALANEEYEQQVGLDACAEPITIPTGESSYPVTVRAEHLGCSGGRPRIPTTCPCATPRFLPGTTRPGSIRATTAERCRNLRLSTSEWSVTHNCRSETRTRVQHNG